LIRNITIKKTFLLNGLKQKWGVGKGRIVIDILENVSIIKKL